MKCAVLLLVFLVYSTASKVSLEFDTPIAIPKGWKRGAEPDENTPIELIIAIRQQNLNSLEAKFHSVSNPQNEDYGNHLDLKQLKALIEPKPEHIKDVIRWLHSSNITTYNRTIIGDFVVTEVPKRVAEQLLECKFWYWHHHSTNTTLIRSLGPYFVPTHIKEAVDFIGGVLRFPKILKPQKKSLRRQDGGINPQVIQQIYNIPANTVGKSSKNSQAVAQFLGQYYAEADLSSFLQSFNLPNQTIAVTIGPNDPTNPGLEANLDTQYIISTAIGVPTWFVSTGGEHQGQERFLHWIVNIINTTNAPWVHSVSYGDDEDSLSKDYADRINVEFQKFGVLGRSILFSSGDDGTGCSSDCKQYVPNYPGSSPYVTTVGGTVLQSDNSQTADSISSGGFSFWYSTGAWQQAAVTNYLKTNQNLPDSSFYNNTGRAIPDIASFSENVVIVYQGQQSSVAGTSCASPVVAGIISLLNDYRFLNNKPSLGFLNYWIYQTSAAHSDAFIDITQGSNGQGCCGNGFSAQAGWDPITGVGTPNFANLLKYV